MSGQEIAGGKEGNTLSFGRGYSITRGREKSFYNVILDYPKSERQIESKRGLKNYG